MKIIQKQKMWRLYQLRETNNTIQIIHVRNNHWAVITTVGLDDEDHHLKYYHSAYSDLSNDTEDIILQLYYTTRFNLHKMEVEIMLTPKQDGSTDCGLYAIAVSTAIANGIDPSQQVFDQDELRPHLLDCLQSRNLIPFPVKKKHRVTNSVIKTVVLYLCPVCEKPNIGEEMVECEKCNYCFHKSCVPPYNNKKDWFCGRCTTELKHTLTEAP